MFKDSRGLMWFGSSEGLCRFDGTNVTVYKHEPGNEASLCHNEITAIIEDNDHNLWIGTAHGLNRYNPQQDRFENIDSLDRNKNHLSNLFITALAQDSRGQLWIGTLGSGINIYDPVNFRFDYKYFNNSRDNYVPVDYITSILIYDDKAWIGTRAGIKIFNTETHEEESLPDVGESLQKKKITRIIHGHDGNLWISTYDGEIVCLSTGQNIHRIKTYQNLLQGSQAATSVTDLGYDRSKNLWLVTENAGISYLNTSSGNVIQLLPDEGNPYSLPSRSIRTVYVTDDERIWIGTYNKGLFFADTRLKKFEWYKRNPLSTESLRGNDVRAFSEDKEGNLWIATDGGLTMFNIKRRETHNPEYINKKLGDKLIKDVLIDTRGNLWIGTRDDGVVMVNLKTNTITDFNVTSSGTGNNKVVCIYEDKRNTIWVGTLGSGLFYFDKNSHRFISLCEKDQEEYIPDKAFVTSIVEATDNTLWVGTLYGLYALQRKTDNIFLYKVYYSNNTLGSLSSSRIQVIYEDPDEQLWFGTYDNGLNLLDKENGTFEHYIEGNGLPNNSIKAIIADSKGNLWISSNSGLSKFNPRTRTSKNYSTEDGLNSNSFHVNACLKTATGEFVFGGDNGFNVFYPDSIHEYNNPPVVHLTDLRINNASLKIGAENSPLKKHIGFINSISLSYDQHSFMIDFAAISYGPPEKNQYCYKLEGFEDTWNCIRSHRTATYTNIDAGNYVLLVKGANSDGVWSEVPARLSITVHPPIWKTWWALLLYTILCISIAYIVYRVRTERIKIKNQLKLEKMEREKEHELTLSKMRFFTNISHELRTPLSLILMPLESIVSSPYLPSAIKKSLHTAYKNATSLMRLVNELMDFSKLDNAKPFLKVQKGEIIQFITEITSSFSDISEKRNITLNIAATPPPLYGWFDRDKLEKILRNVLSNAFKFSPDNGDIKVLIDIKNQNNRKHNEPASRESQESLRYLEVIVIDNGVGIAPDELPFIFDKFYQAKSSFNIQNPGTGIGLSLTKALIELHHGNIIAESVPDKETRFIITFPIDKCAYPDEEVIEAPMDILENDHDHASYESVVIDPNLGKPELLIIEDNDELREYLVAEFSIEFSVTEAKDGNDGLLAAFEKIPDLIVSDVVMPTKTGIELCREIKSDIRTSHIPFILLTAKTTTEDQVKGLETGADVYVTKPFSARVLKAHVKQIILARRKLYVHFSQDAYLMPGNLTSNEIDKEFLQKAIDFINENLLNTQLSVESIAELFNLSRSQVYRKIKALTGQTVVEFIRVIRLKHALKLMETKKYTLSEVSYLSGFNSLSYFTRSFKDQYGKAPSEYITEAKNE